MARFVVRYGVMRFLGVLSARGNDSYMRGDQVIARTPRGLEVGEVLSFADEETVKHLKEAPTGQILRKMTVGDSSEWSHLSQKLTESFETCRQFVNKLDLPMELVDIEQMFGGERLVIYYLSESRVDFRDLVKQLASEFQTRIEMRQIGVRDEAKLLADYGDCGKPLCCNTHLSAMPPVSMKMAKLQKATLDPTKISGRCGRLKCCLRYEYDTYRELQRDLPPVGCEIVTQQGRGKVLGQEILAGQLLVQMEDMRRILVDASDVLTVISGKKKARKN